MSLDLYIEGSRHIESHHADTTDVKSVMELVLEGLEELGRKSRRYSKNELILKLYRYVTRNDVETSVETIARYLRRLRQRKIITSHNRHYIIILYNVRTELRRRVPGNVQYKS